MEHFDTLRGIPLCYGRYAGTTEDFKSKVMSSHGQSSAIFLSLHGFHNTCHSASSALPRSRLRCHRSDRACSAWHPSTQHRCTVYIPAHSNPMTRNASRQQSRFVSTKLARTQRLRSEKACSKHYLGELQLVRGTGTVLRTGVDATAGAVGAVGAVGAPAVAGAGAGAGAAAGAAAAEAAAGAPAGAWWLAKAIASNMHDHRGRQHKQQRAREWILILMVSLRRQERRLHLGQPRTGQRWRRF